MIPSASARISEEIKRLQQLQRLRTATAACSFPSVGDTGGLLSAGSSSNNTGDTGPAGLSVNLATMDNRNANLWSSNSASSNPVLASFLAQHQQQQQQQQQQQDETRLMLLQHQLRLNPSSSGSYAVGQANSGNPLQLGSGGSFAMPSNIFPHSGLSLPTPSSLVHQQQLLLQQQQQQQQQQQNEPMVRPPLMRVGAIEPFPEKLHRMLMEVEQCGRGDVISFINNGRGFAIHKPDTFFQEIVPLYFRHSRLSSFKRQLNLYGFEQINIGPYRGGYYHEMLHRDTPETCRRMRRVAVKVSGATTLKKKKEQEAKAEAEAKANTDKDKPVDEDGDRQEASKASQHEERQEA